MVFLLKICLMTAKVMRKIIVFVQNEDQTHRETLIFLEKWLEAKFKIINKKPEATDIINNS